MVLVAFSESCSPPANQEDRMFEKFKKFVDEAAHPNQSTPNQFWPVSESKLREAERLIGARLPDTLRRFHQEVGYGFFTQGIQNESQDEFLINRLMDPRSIADILINPISVQRPPEGFPNGGIPFFDVGDYTYLVIKATPSTPDGVFWPDGKKLVSKSLTEFFESLYRDAKFYKLRPSAKT
jgi:antitoxin YxxD